MRDLEVLVEVLDYINSALLSLQAIGHGADHLWAERNSVLASIAKEYASFQARFSYSPELRPDIAHALAHEM